MAHDEYNKATDWFEPLYSKADADGKGVPWARMAPNPALDAWLKQAPIRAGRALVVGCGLGDDAELMARSGFEVTAFDVAPSAIQLAQERFPDSRVDYQVADLFNPPAAWSRHFDVVVEFITVQALPPHLQAEAAAQVASFVSSWLVMGSLVREAHVTPQGPPWPISSDTLTVYRRAGMTEVERHEEVINTAPKIWRVQAVYQREG